MLAPNGRKRVRAVAARFIAGGGQDVAPALDAWDFALQNTQLRRIHLVVGGVYRKQGRLYLLQIGPRIVVSRAIELVQHIVRVHRPRLVEAALDRKSTRLN